MALFNKLFFSSSSKRKTLNANQHQHYLSQFPFEKNQVRILLYRECDNRGRRLLFDSSAIQKVTTKEGADFSTTISEKISSFDEKSKYKGFTNSSKTYVRISDEFLYKHGRPTADITSIGEMIFGALAMSFRGTSLKVHWLQSPMRILSSQVFLSPIHSNGPSGLKQSKENSDQSLSENYLTDNNSVNSFSKPFSLCINRRLTQFTDTSDTVPLDVSDAEINPGNAQRYSIYSAGDSGYGGTEVWTASVSSCYQYSTRSSFGSVFDNQESSRKLSIDSTTEESYYASNMTNNKWSGENFQRRISRNMCTSFENRTSKSDFVGYIGDNCETVTNGGSDGCVTQFQKLIASETHSNPEIIRQRRASGETSLSDSGRSRHFIKRAKLGLAVCITMTEKYENEMGEFCCEHIALLESMLCRLRASVENAYINHRNFLQIMLHAWQVTAYWLTDLFSAPRLPCPIWSNLGNFDNKKSKIVADSFMKELCWLLSFADTKDTNFFISKVLTAVLTNHLGWVTIISSIKSTSSGVAETTQNSVLNEVSQKYPYNALWAQIGDLYGAIGSPPKISRTIVYGQEKLSLERLLNILTYFIRCGEIRKMPKREVIDKTILNEFVQKQKEAMKVHDSKQTQKSGLIRSRTCVKNLGETNLQENQNFQNESCDGEIEKSLMNDIPKVLPFSDSQFMQSVLGIPNHLMDTVNETRVDEQRANIRLTITNPDNVEIPVDSINCDVAEEPEVVEATELQSPFIEEKVKSFSFKDFSWNIGPVKEGLSWETLQKLQKGIQVINNKIRETKIMQKSNSATKDLIYEDIELKFRDQGKLKKQTSLSDLITANSVGQSEVFTWEIEPTKETVCLEEETHFELSKKIIERKKISQEKNSDVVFVLGDNEALVNIKKSNENLSDVNKKITQSNSQRICSHHKKHSGVKFNFEQYPQIATNYMKNKNLELSNYDFFEKSSKFEEMFKDGPSTSSFAVELPKTKSNSCEECEYCAGTRTLQTPSNATELEFETNDSYSVSPLTSNDLPLTKIQENAIDFKNENSSTEKLERRTNIEEHSEILERRTKNQSDILSIIQVPVPSILDDGKTTTERELRCGFIPSLLIGVTDRYIPDMVLQGTLSSPRTWETDLRQDLVLASRCASFNSASAENVAIIADMEKWDVKILSSQTHSLPFTGSITSPVGMSQLVSTMLETVQAMSNSGISSCECLSYIESKLQEMYLQSEVLAAFLLATEFCSLNTLTSTLNLSVNDVPLLISVASIHSPQVTKKYGVSFRNVVSDILRLLQESKRTESNIRRFLLKPQTFNYYNSVNFDHRA